VATEQPTIKLRIDVDYPYESRAKSFLYVALRIKSKKSESYLKNTRVIAQMINESPRNVRAYWFFTPYTIPDQRLLKLLNPERHEVALHVATKPFQEWKILENETNRTVQYYTIHGTRRLFARLLWGRGFRQGQAPIPSDFPVKSFHEAKTLGLDTIRYSHGFEGAKKGAEQWISEDIVLSIHPDWLFKTGGHRGPFYDVLKSILEVDADLDNLSTRKILGVKIGRSVKEYQYDAHITDQFLDKLRLHGVDIYSFIDRRWCCPNSNLPSNWKCEDDNVGLLEIKTYDEWYQAVGKKTRNMIRKAEKSGVKIEVVEPSDRFAEGISKIYNETPIRQERAFPHYGEPLESVKGNMYAVAKTSTFIGAYLDDELVGFIQVLYGDHIAIISNILAMQAHWDKALNNAMLAKAVEVCASRGERWLMYGRIGNHPSLDRFKDSNGFKEFPIARVYIPLTDKGATAIRLRLHQELKDALPNAVKYPLIPALNWVSRNKVGFKLWLRKSRR
jgi:hypothetical protein